MKLLVTKVLPVFVFMLLVPFMSQNVIAAGKADSNPWQLVKQENGIQVYLRNTPGSAVKTFRGVVSIPTRLASLVAALDTTSSYPRWLLNCVSAKSIKTNGTTQSYNHVVTSMPWPVQNRDSITHATLQQDKKTKQILIRMNSVPNMLPRKPGVVRIEKMFGNWLLTPQANGLVRVSYEMTIDPGGSLPKWLVNTMVVDLPFYTLENLRKIVNEPAFKNARRPSIFE